MSVVCTRINEDSIAIAADSFRSHGWLSQDKDPRAKLFQEGGFTVGGVGHSEEMGLFHLFLMTRKLVGPSERDILELMSEFRTWAQKETDAGSHYSLSNSYHIVVDGKAFVTHGFDIQEITEYDAIGAGEAHALAALYLGASPQKAVETAAHHSPYVELPVVSFTLPRF